MQYLNSSCTYRLEKPSFHTPKEVVGTTNLYVRNQPDPSVWAH